MNGPPYSDEQLESALRGLPLQKPSEMMDHRVARALTRRTFSWRGLAAAACFGGLCFWLGTGVGQGGPADGPGANGEPAGQPAALPAPAETPDLRLASAPKRVEAKWPIAHAQFTYDVQDGPPLRATVQDAITRTRWTDPDNNRNVELTRPVREVFFTRQDPQ